MAGLRRQDDRINGVGATKGKEGSEDAGRLCGYILCSMVVPPPSSVARLVSSPLLATMNSSATA